MNQSPASEADLLAMMARQRSRPDEARAAWEELYVRHRRYLLAVVSRSYASFLRADGVDDLVSDTFRRAYQWAGKQQDPDAVRTQFSTETQDRTRRRVLGWLGAIAERLFKDRFREHRTEAAEFTLFVDEFRKDEEEPAEDIESQAQSTLQSALASLNATEQEALRVSLPWYDPTTRTFAVSRGEAARIAEQLGITPESLRQRRHRAIKKLEQCLEQAGSMSFAKRVTP